MTEALNWRDNAECLQYPPDLWFPEKGESNRAAKKVCNMLCEVRDDCLTSALQRGDNEFGVIGGLDAKERRKLRKKAI